MALFNSNSKETVKDDKILFQVQVERSSLPLQAPKDRRHISKKKHIFLILHGQQKYSAGASDPEPHLQNVEPA